MPVTAGETFLLPKPGHDTPHLWIVLTEPDEQNHPHVVIVNLTTRRSGSDMTVVLIPRDHPFVSHETVVLYADTKIAPAQKLVDAVTIGIATRSVDLRPDVLERVQDGLFQSRFTPEKVKAYCRGRW